MKVFLNQINGIDDALISVTMTRRTWTEELDKDIRYLVNMVTDEKGYFNGYDGNVENAKVYEEKLSKLLSYACDIRKENGEFVNTGHITLLSFIDLSITVEGLHYAGMADLDSHAYRFHNRILRTSSRARQNAYMDNELSEYYDGKIIPTDLALCILGQSLPETLNYNGKIYVKTVNGYVLQDYERQQDVKRGLYMLSIPSNCIFRCNLMQFCHIYQQRNYKGHANPEVKECVESIADLIQKAQPLITKEYLETVHQ